MLREQEAASYSLAGSIRKVVLPPKCSGYYSKGNAGTCAPRKVYETHGRRRTATRAQEGEPGCLPGQERALLLFER